MATDQPLSARAGEALLRLGADPDANHTATLAALSDCDWRALLQSAIEARLIPIVARAVERSGIRAEPPADVAAAIASECRWHSLNTLRQQAAVARLTRTLDKLGFAPIALKGVALAHCSYPDPVLRPMRDLDLLLPAEQAEAAQDALLATEAYTIHPDLRGTRRTSPEHLPPLQDAVLSVTVEIHHRIGTWGGADALRKSLVERAGRHRIGGTGVEIPSPETNLLHLVAGAAIKDRLAISSLVLADLHYLARGTLDWDEVWELAGRTGLRNALALLAGVAARYGATWMPPALAEAAERSHQHIDAAAAALLQPASVSDRRKIVDRVGRAGESGGSVRGALSLALSPEPVQLARIVGVAPASGWRWAGYPIWLVRRVFTYARAWGEARRMDGEAVKTMRTWLEQE